MILLYNINEIEREVIDFIRIERRIKVRHGKKATHSRVSRKDQNDFQVPWQGL